MTTIGQQLNTLFKQVYNLYSDTIIFSNKIVKNSCLEREVYTFVKTIKIKIDLNNIENTELDKLYFKYDYFTICYPFNNNLNNINSKILLNNKIFTIFDILNYWNELLQSIIIYSEDEDICKAKNIKKNINKFKKKYFN